MIKCFEVVESDFILIGKSGGRCRFLFQLEHPSPDLQTRLADGSAISYFVLPAFVVMKCIHQYERKCLYLLEKRLHHRKVARQATKSTELLPESCIRATRQVYDMLGATCLRFHQSIPEIIGAQYVAPVSSNSKY